MAMKFCVKTCGITNVEDAKIVAQLGADFIGVVLEIEYSPRSVSVETAISIIECSSIPVILLLEKPYSEMEEIALKAKPYGVQLIGGCSFQDIKRLKASTGCVIWKTVHLPTNSIEDVSFNNLKNVMENYHSAGVDVIVLDTMTGGQKGGTGHTCDWASAARLVVTSTVPIVLAGGITPANVQEAINTVHPYGIDLSSGIEKIPGKKDPEKISKLMQNIDKLVKSH